MPRLPIAISYYNPVVERMPREQLVAWQWRRLKHILERAYYSNPFYREKLQRAKCNPDNIRSWDDFRNRVPHTTKSETVEDVNDRPPYGHKLGVPEDSLARFYMTPGKAGLAQEVYGLTRADVERGASGVMGFFWAGARKGDVVANTWPTSLGNTAGPDNMAHAIVRLGANQLHLGITFSTEQKIELLKRFNPHLIIAIGGFFIRLTTSCREAGIQPRRDFPRLKAIVGGGLAFSAAWLEQAEEFWDARIHDFYGITQAANVCGFTCEKGIVLAGKRSMTHLWEHLNVFEVLDRESRQPVAPGEEGELVITNLGREASAVIRFATNDKVRFLPHTACDCGRPFAGFEVGSIARYDDMIRIKQVNIWPQAVDGVLFSAPEIGEYQARCYITQEGHEEIRMVVEFKPGTGEGRKKELLAALPPRLRSGIGVTMVLAESREALPRPDFPAQRWKDERGKGSQAEIAGG